MNKTKNNVRPSELITKIVCAAAAALSVAAVIAICLFMFVNGIPAIAEIGPFKFLFGGSWAPSKEEFGIFPMIIGSIYVTAGAVASGVPIGILTAVFLAKYCPRRLYKIIKPAINLLAGIPSIIYGFFGLVVIVPAVQQLFGTNGKGILTASLLLGIMILPTVISTSEAAISSVPCHYFEGSLALGATKERSIFKAMFPAAQSGILSGVVLGIGRAIGETMAVVMVAGNQPLLPDSPLSGVRTLTSNIVLEMAYASGLHRDALIATAVVLFIFILIINLSLSAVRRKA